MVAAATFATSDTAAVTVPFRVAEMVAVWLEVVPAAAIVNVAEDWPAPTGTELGTLKEATFDESPTRLPELGADWEIVTVQDPDEPAVSVGGEHEIEVTTGLTLGVLALTDALAMDTVNT